MTRLGSWKLHLWKLHVCPKVTIPPLGWCPRWRGYSPVGLYGYVPLNRVWYSGSSVLHRVYDFTIKRLEQGVFFARNPFKECEGYGWAVSNVYQQLLLYQQYFCTMSNSIVLVLNITYRLYAKWNESGSQNKVSCLKQGSKINNFYLKQGQGVKDCAAQLYPKYPSVSPPGEARLPVIYS